MLFSSACEFSWVESPSVHRLLVRRVRACWCNARASRHTSGLCSRSVTARAICSNWAALIEQLGWLSPRSRRRAEWTSAI